MREPGRGRRLETVLFTDIVSSTDVAAKLGDARWRELLARHNALIRRELRRFGGREVDTAGDGFFVTFRAPADGVRCACAASEAVRRLGIEIRAGLHFGEIEQMKPKVTGIAVVTASRIASLADSGEVFVSSTVEELVAGSGVGFEDRGPQALKGVPGVRHIFAVTSVDGSSRAPPLEHAEAERRLDAIQPPPFVRRHRWWIGVAAALTAAALVSLFLVTRPPAPPAPITVRPNSLVRIDPRSNTIIADVPLATHPGTSQLTFVPPSQIWVMSQQDQVISVVDTETNERVRLIGGFGGQANPSIQVAGEGIVYAFGKVWASGPRNKVDRLDPTSGSAESSVRIPGTPDLLERGFGRVWVASHELERVFAIDPRSGRVTLTAAIGVDVSGIAAGEGAVWVSTYVDGAVSRIDPRSGTSTQIEIELERTVDDTTATVAGGPSGVGIGFSSVWVADTPLGVVHRIDAATDRLITTIPIGRAEGPPFIALSDIVAADGSLWVTSPASRTIVRIDPATNSVVGRINVPYTPRTMITADGDMWVTVESN